MTSSHFRALISSADSAISHNDFDALMNFYADDAMLVLKPGTNIFGKDAIRQAFIAIANYFKYGLTVRQGAMQVLQGGDTALVIMETILDIADEHRSITSVTRRATYVFREYGAGQWLCVIDNSYGTDLLSSPELMEMAPPSS